MQSAKDAALLLFEQLQRHEELNIVFRTIFKDLTPEELEVFDVTILNCINCQCALSTLITHRLYQFLLREAASQLLQTLRNWPLRFMNDVDIFCWNHMYAWNGYNGERALQHNIFVDTIVRLQREVTTDKSFAIDFDGGFPQRRLMCANDAIQILDVCVRNLSNSISRSLSYVEFQNNQLKTQKS